MSDSNSDSDSDELPIVMSHLVRTRGNKIDFDWLWENRNDIRHTSLVKQHFFSETLPKDMSEKYKRQLIILRKFIVKLYNVRQRKKDVLTTEVLNARLIGDLIRIVLEYDEQK